jgi:phage gp36-like protein
MYADRATFDLAFGVTEANELETPAVGRIAQALAMAIATADSYMAVRYVTPVDSAGAVLRHAVLDIARYTLWDDRAPEEVRLRYEDALKWLRDVAAGKAAVITATGAQATLISGADGTGGASGGSGIAASVRSLDYGDSFTGAYDSTRFNAGGRSWP